MAAETENQIVVYRPNETIRLDIRLENETVWLTQERMCELFQRERSVITKHIRKVFSEGECDEKNNAQILHMNQPGGLLPCLFYEGLLRDACPQFNDQHKGLEVKTSAAFHDRFLIIDGKELYLIGASLKDLGRKCFGFTTLDKSNVPGILAKIRG